MMGRFPSFLSRLSTDTIFVIPGSCWDLECGFQAIKPNGTRVPVMSSLQPRVACVGPSRGEAGLRKSPSACPTPLWAPALEYYAAGQRLVAGALSPQHPDVATALVNMGGALQRLEEPGRAYECYHEAWPGLRGEPGRWWGWGGASTGGMTGRDQAMGGVLWLA